MYLKSIGCVLILFSSVFLGYSFKLQTQRTLSAYENLLLCMQVFERDIRHSLNDILTITSQVAGIATDANLLLFKTFYACYVFSKYHYNRNIYNCHKSHCYIGNIP